MENISKKTFVGFYFECKKVLGSKKNPMIFMQRQVSKDFLFFIFLFRNKRTNIFFESIFQRGKSIIFEESFFLKKLFSDF